MSNKEVWSKMDIQNQKETIEIFKIYKEIWHKEDISKASGVDGNAK